MTGYRPSCQARSPSECSNCNLAYDCVQKRQGRGWLWPVAALAILGALALINFTA